jgi:hypothetical protein
MTMHVLPGAREPERSYRLEVAFDEVAADLLAAMAAWTRERISPASRVVLARRAGGFVVQIAAAWDDPSGDAVNVAWARACYADLARRVAQLPDTSVAVR